VFREPQTVFREPHLFHFHLFLEISLVRYAFVPFSFNLKNDKKLKLF
jgi:hypothetical protein